MSLDIKKRIQAFIQKTPLEVSQDTRRCIEVKDVKNYCYGKKRK